MEYEELDETTRKCMLAEFESELRSRPYRLKTLSDEGWRQFPQLVKDAIRNGDDDSLAQALYRPAFFQDTQRKTRNSMTKVRTNTDSASKRLALTEFNTLYVRGLCRRLMDEGVELCQVYRAADVDQPRCECTAWEGQDFPVKKVYEGHRARYHGREPDQAAFSVPSGPNCHHSIRRTP